MSSASKKTSKVAGRGPKTQSETLYRTLVNAAEEGIALVDTEERIIFANPKMAHFLGYEPEELLGRSLLDFIPKDEHKTLRSQTARRKKGESSRYELTIVSRQGKRHRMLVTATPIYDSEGKFYASTGIMTDITELKLAEEEIIRRNEELGALLQTNTELSTMLDTEEVGRLITQRANELVVVEGCTFYRMDKDSETLVPVATTLADVRDEIMAYHVPLGEGSSGQAAAQARPLLVNDFEDDPLLSRIGASDKKRALAVPLISHNETLGVLTLVRLGGAEFTEHDLQLLTLFARQAADALAKSDLFTRLRELNESLEKKVKERTEALERAGKELEKVHSAYKGKVTDRLSRIAPVMEKVSVGDFTDNIALPEEEDEFTELLVGLNLMIDDLRFMFEENRRRSEELHRLNENLEQIVRERTAELEESNRKTAAFARELEEIIYVASHDLKTPLRAISGFSQFLYEDYYAKLGNEGKLYLNRLIDATKHIEKLLDDLLDVSAIGRTEQRFERVKASDLVAEAIRLVAIDNAEIIYDPKTLPEILCDPGRMVEVFYNLISNGLKFNDKPLKRVNITARKLDGFHEFTVQDNGIGIDKRHYERIFNIFQRLHPRGRFGGTGVGLSMVKRVVEDHNGRIWVESEVGVGTIFHFTLPEGRDEQKAERSA